MRFASLLAPIAHDGFRAIAAELAEALRRRPTFSPTTWREIIQMLHRPAREPRWIFACGWHYVQARALAQARVVPVVAPILPSSSETSTYACAVVMHRDRAVENVHALRGKRWAYNEENSHSGFQLPEHFLAAHGLGANFFASKIRSGSHARSIELVLEGQADATGIDSWVLALWRDHHRHVAHELVEIGRIGPSPSPPLIAIDASPDEICAAQTELERLQHSARGREALTRAGISRFVRRVDADYDPIRTIARELASRSPR